MIHGVLDREVCASLADYLANGGGRGLRAAQHLDPLELIAVVTASGLRGRGGAGFPTGRKWETIAAASSPAARTPVIVNAAEGEPGTFKDRTLLRRNPYKVIEGALVVAVAIDAREVVIAVKGSFTRELRRIERAIEEYKASGLAPAVQLRVAKGPDAYLFGEETALLEVIEGRQPFPRVTPPYRRGLDPNETDPQRTASHTDLAVSGGSDEPPALVNNVETLANIPAIVADGVDWFRSLGTAQSPGTLLCTITGRTRQHGVGEYPMGTPLRDVVDEVGGGPRPGRHLVAAISGVANAILPAELFATGLTYEAMANAGAGLGVGGFIIFDNETDLMAVAYSIARFLAVESCGQCEPCKRDGIALADYFDRLRSSTASLRDLDAIGSRLDTVTRGARCFLAYQQERTLRSILGLFPYVVRDHLDRDTPSSPVELIAPVVDIVAGRALLDTSHLTKQPDWTHAPTDSGTFPAALYGDTPLTISSPRIREYPAVLNRAVEHETAEDTFDQIRDSHRQIAVTLTALRDAPNIEALRLVLKKLDEQLRLHLDVMTRILYPTLTRHVPGLGDDSAWTAEHDADIVLRLGDRILDAHRSADAAAVVELTNDIQDHIDSEEQTIIPLLIAHLDDSELLQLRNAMAEARLDSTANTGD